MILDPNRTATPLLGPVDLYERFGSRNSEHVRLKASNALRINNVRTHRPYQPVHTYYDNNNNDDDDDDDDLAAR